MAHLYRSVFRTLGLPAACLALAALSTSCSSENRGITMVNVPAPVATSLVASAGTPVHGGSFTLTATYSSGTAVISYSGGGTGTVPASPTTVASDPVSANWSGTRVYTLTVTNAANISATTTASVTPQAVVVGAITPVPSASTMLTSTSQAFSATVTGGLANTVTWSSSGIGSWLGNTWTAPALPGPVTITATSVDDPARAMTLLLNVVQTPVAGGLVATKPTLTSGGITMLTPTFSGGTATIGTTGVGSSDLSASATSGTGISTGVLTANTLYTMTVTNTATPPTIASVTTTVTVVAAPTGSITSSSASPLYGATNVTVTPVFAGGTAVLGTSRGGNDVGTTLTSGTPVPVQPGGFVATTTYWLCVTNAAGDVTDSSVTITKQTPAISAVSPATVNLTVAATQAFLATVTNAASSAITWSVDGVPGGNASLGPINSSGLYTAGTTVGAHTITATAVADGTTNSTATATVFAAPTAPSLTPSSVSPLFGATFTLTPVYSNGAGVINNGVTCPATGVASAPITANWTQGLGRSYSLIVTNGADTTATASVSVTPQVVRVASVTPATPTVTAGSTTTFASSVSGASNADILWSASAGTIDATTGVWTAPATASSAVTITATSRADATKLATTSVTVVLPSVTLTADASYVSVGGTFHLVWTSTYVDHVDITNYGSSLATSGSVPVTPVATLTYTARAYSAGGALLATSSPVMVSVEAPVALTSFTASPAQVNFGGFSTLNWAFSGTPKELTVNGTSVLGLPGTTVSPVMRQAFTLLGRNNVSSDAKTISVAAKGLDLLAGSNGGAGSVDGTGMAAKFNCPQGMAVDASGNVYVADYGNAKIRMITPAGVVTTLAGSGASGYADGTGSAASFSGPYDLAVDLAGNIYVADGLRVRKIDTTPARNVTTLAGGGAPGYTDGAGGAARFGSATGIAVDLSGNVYVADSGNNRIRLITPLGVVTTFPSAALSFYRSSGLAVDPSGNVYVADFLMGTVSKVTPGGVVTTFASGPFVAPRGLAADSIGNVYVADEATGAISKVTPVGVVIPVAGGTSGYANGTGAAAQFNSPRGIAIDASGNVYIADSINNAIRKITPATVVTTLAGGGGALSAGSVDGTGAAARFNGPGSVATDGLGNAYVKDFNTGKIRQIAPGGVVTTLALGQVGSVDSVAADAVGNVFVLDATNNVIWKVPAGGAPTVLAGTLGSLNTYGDGAGTAAQFMWPSSLTIDTFGNLYLLDGVGGRGAIRKVTPAGLVTTLMGGASGSIFSSPSGLTVDPTTGNIYVADCGAHAILAITPGGVLTTLAGSGASGFADGTGGGALFSNPHGLAADAWGNVYVADTDNNTIRKVTPAGVVTTLLGAGGGTVGIIPGLLAYGSALPLPTGYGSLVAPKGIAVTAAGDLVVCSCNAILQVTAP